MWRQDLPYCAPREVPCYHRLPVAPKPMTTHTPNPSMQPGETSLHGHTRLSQGGQVGNCTSGGHFSLSLRWPRSASSGPSSHCPHGETESQHGLGWPGAPKGVKLQGTQGTPGFVPAPTAPTISSSSSPPPTAPDWTPGIPQLQAG